MRYVHTNIISPNWQRLADFYIRTFSCTIKPPPRKQAGDWLAQGTGLEHAQLEGLHLRLPGFDDLGPTLEIYQYTPVVDHPTLQPNHRGYTHIAFEVDDVAQILKLVIQNGGSANGQITQRVIEGVGTITFVYARDPDGNLIELQSWKKE